MFLDLTHCRLIICMLTWRFPPNEQKIFGYIKNNDIRMFASSLGVYFNRPYKYHDTNVFGLIVDLNYSVWQIA